MCVGVCVCTLACVYACLCLLVHVSACVFVFVRVSACVCLFVSVFMVFIHYISEENKLEYIEVSALDASNVNVAFRTLFNGKHLRLTNFNGSCSEFNIT